MKLLAGLAALHAALLLALHPRLINPDGVGTMAYLPAVFNRSSLWVGDVFQSAELRMPVTVSPAGLIGDQYPVGSAMLWAPSFLAAKAGWALSRGGEFPALAQKYAANWASMLLGLLAVRLSLGALRKTGARRPAATAFLALAGTPLLFYVLVDTSMAHASSAFAVSLFLWTWLETGIGTLSVSRLALLGLLAGVMGTVRLQDAGYAAVLAADLHVAWSRGERRGLAALAAFCAAFCAGFLPQAYVTKQFFGAFLANPQSDLLKMSYAHCLELLLPSIENLFLWTPLIPVGIAGLAWGAARGERGRRPVCAGLLLALAVQLVIMALYPFQGRAFGLRRLSSSVLPVALGLGMVLDAGRGRRAAARAAGAALLACWSLLLAWAAARGLALSAMYLAPSELAGAQWTAVRRPELGGLLGAPAWWREFGASFLLPLALAEAWTVGLAYLLARLVRASRPAAAALVLASSVGAFQLRLARSSKAPPPGAVIDPARLAVSSSSGYGDFFRLMDDVDLFDYHRRKGSRERMLQARARILEDPATDAYTRAVKEAVLGVQLDPPEAR